MDCATRIRSDYHDHTPKVDELHTPSLRLVKVFFWIFLGFLLGVGFRQWLAWHATPSQSPMDKPSTVAMRQVSDIVFQEHPLTANA